MSGLVCAPLGIEGWMLRGLPVLRVGMGCRKVLPHTGEPVVVAGVAGGLAPQVRPGDVVVADEIRRADRGVPVPSARLLAEALRELSLTVHCGPIVSSESIVHGHKRKELAAGGALAVDMESAALAATCTGPIAVVRSIVDTDSAPLVAPGTLWRGIRALRSLRQAVPALRWWLTAMGDKPVEVT